MKRGKRYQESLKLIEKGTSYDAKEAFALIEKMPKAKFDETIEAHFKLGVDSKHADQQVRGVIVLPHGTGKTQRVLVFAKGDKAKEAEEVKVFYENPENYANLVLSELTTKYKEDGFDAGEEDFNDVYSKAEDNELRGELCIAHARAIVNIFNNEKIDLAIEIALEADELRQNDRTALLLVELYSRKGDNYKSQEYESLYNKRADNSEKGEG